MDTILSKYLSKKITLVFISIFLIFSLLVISNQFILIAKEDINFGLSNPEISKLIFFKYLRDSGYVITFSLSISIIYTFNKLYKNSEAIILKSASIGDLRLLSFLSPLILLITLLSSFLYLFSYPNINLNIEKLHHYIESKPDFINLKHNTFQEFNNNKFIFFGKDADSKSINEFDDVFISSSQNSKIIIAKHAKKIIDEYTGDVYLSLFNGRIYDLENEVLITEFKNNKILIYDNLNSIKTFNSKENQSKSFTGLALSNNLEEYRELYYRISQPITVVIMSIFAVYFSNSSTNYSRNFGIIIGVLGYIFYFNTLLIARNYDSDSFYETILVALIPHLVMLLLIYIKSLKDKFI